MDACPVCHFDGTRDDTVDEVFRIGGDYVLVRGVPARVCLGCGELAFAAETAEAARLAARGAIAPTSVMLKVVEFAS